MNLLCPPSLLQKKYPDLLSGADYKFTFLYFSLLLSFESLPSHFPLRTCINTLLLFPICRAQLFIFWAPGYGGLGRAELTQACE